MHFCTLTDPERDLCRETLFRFVFLLLKFHPGLKEKSLAEAGMKINWMWIAFLAEELRFVFVLLFSGWKIKAAALFLQNNLILRVCDKTLNLN